MKTILWATFAVLVCVAALLGILFVLEMISQAEMLDYGSKIGGIVIILAVAVGIIKGVSRGNNTPAV